MKLSKWQDTSILNRKTEKWQYTAIFFNGGLNVLRANVFSEFILKNQFVLTIT